MTVQTLAGIPMSALRNSPTSEELGKAVAQLSAADLADFFGWWEDALARRLGGYTSLRLEEYMLDACAFLTKRGGIAAELEGACNVIHFTARHIPTTRMED